MDSMAETASSILLDGLRRLAASTDYDPVKGDIFGNEWFSEWLLIVVTVLVIGLGSLAAGAGIGGGGLFVPIFAFILGIGAKAAVPMSKATILGGALGNMVSIAFARHPDSEKDRPLIDYEASAFMQSGELLGVVFGVLLNLILPEILIIVFLALLLSFNAYKTLTKAVSKYKEETKKADLRLQLEAKVAAKAAKTGGEISCADEAPVAEKPRASVSSDASDSTSASSKVDEPISPGLSLGNVQASAPARESSALLEKVLARDRAQFPLWAWALLLPMTAYTVVYAVVKKDYISICDPAAYWIWYFSPVPVLGGCMLVTAFILRRFHCERVAAGYAYKGAGEESPEYRDMQWTDDVLKKFPLIAILAGVAAGLLGIGGGMVIGPLFIQLDMQPKVGSSSCAFMILWTAISGVVQYAMAGKLGLQFILYGIVVGFVSGQLGQRFVDSMLKKSGRPSYVIFLLGGIVATACIAMTCTGVWKLVEGLAEGRNVFQFDTYDFECHQ